MMRKKFMLLVVACVLSSQLGIAEAEPEGTALSASVTLLEETPIYSSPDDTLEPIGAIAPQDVHVIGAEENWFSYEQVTDQKWFKVQTWMGDRWIRLELRRMGLLEKIDMNLWLGKETRLNESPLGDMDAGLALLPQTVRIVAEYRNKFQSSYLAETWAGNKWIMDPANQLFPVTKTNEQLVLSTAASKFDIPVPYGGDTGVLKPQTVTSFEQYADNWHHVRTVSGEETWINKKFAEPEGAQPTDESIEVQTVTPLHKYPYAYEINMGAIVPQTVKAYEKWVSPKGEAWYHIQSWQGNAWIRPITDTPYLDAEAALKIAKQMDTAGNPEWTTEFFSEYQDEPSKDMRPVWIVTALYPAGNRMIVYVDAVTGRILQLTETEPPVKEEPSEQTEPHKYEPQFDSDFITMANQGKLKGIDVVIGTSKQDLIQSLGEPDEIGSRNAEYYRYDNCFFYLNEQDDRVQVIDVKIERTAAQIKELLGKPHYDGPNEGDVDGYAVGYEAGSYYLYFMFPTEDSKTGVMRFKNPHGGY